MYWLLTHYIIISHYFFSSLSATISAVTVMILQLIKSFRPSLVERESIVLSKTIALGVGGAAIAMILVTMNIGAGLFKVRKTIFSYFVDLTLLWWSDSVVEGFFTCACFTNAHSKLVCHNTHCKIAVLKNWTALRPLIIS